MNLLAYTADPRIVAATMVGALGAVVLGHPRPQAHVYVRWLGGAALIFGVCNLVVRGGEIAGWLPATLAGPMGAIVGLVTWAMAAAGLQAFFSPGGRPPGSVFLGTIVASLLLFGVMTALWRGWPFAGPAAVSITFFMAAAWVARLSLRHQWRAGWIVAAGLLLHPQLLLFAIGEGMTLPQFRSMTPLPIALAFVVVIMLTTQRDAQLLNAELAARQQAEATLRAMTGHLDELVHERTRQLHDMVRGLRSFAGMLSHDLRGPIGNVVNLAELAQEDFARGDAAKATHWLTLLRGEAERGHEMVEDLLTLAAVDEAEPALQQVNMNTLVDDCVAALALQYPAAPQVVRAEPLPPALCDPALMRHALVNLLSNALKFGAATPTLQVSVRGEATAAGPRFEISDNGPGFDAARAPRLFEPFVRASGPEVPGTGLGLAVVKRVVERHGGTLGARSQPGHGATFWWTLPAAA